MSAEEFEEYFSNFSVCISDDHYFEQIVGNSFRAHPLSASQPQRAQTAAQSQTKEVEHRSKITQNAPFGTSNITPDYSTSLRPNTPQIRYQQQDIRNLPAGRPSWTGYSWRPQSAAQIDQQQQLSYREIIEKIREKVLTR